MDRFKTAVEDLIGIQLTDEETILLYTKYKYVGSKFYTSVKQQSYFIDANDV